MDNKYKKLSEEFESKLRNLFSNYQRLQEQNDALKNQLKEKEIQLKKAHYDIVVLEDKCRHLQIAGSVSGNTEERLAAKRQIDKMVQEIDKCIALLDE
jgi:translation initiation factor 2B subunit (eIF-2B alpha/beta/delta family)